MPERSSKKDFNELAFSIVQRATGEKPVSDQGDVPPLSDALDNIELRKEIMREMGSRGGRKGGVVRSKNLTPERRTEIARKAAATRWNQNLKGKKDVT